MRLYLMLVVSLLSFSCAKDRSADHLMVFSPKRPVSVDHFDLPDVIQKPFMTMLGHQSDWYQGIDERLLDAVYVFEEQAGYSVDIPVVISSVKGKYGKGLAGVCIQVKSADYKAVVIDRDWYHNNKEHPLMIEHAVLHELGHCLLGYGHDNEMMWKDGIKVPVSIMNSYTWSTKLISYYGEYRDRYFERYFQ
ncbi:MAG: hypothetical protein AB8C84_00905 [Oligoflexales bacterium]